MRRKGQGGSVVTWCDIGHSRSPLQKLSKRSGARRRIERSGGMYEALSSVVKMVNEGQRVRVESTRPELAAYMASVLLLSQTLLHQHRNISNLYSNPLIINTNLKTHRKSLHVLTSSAKSQTNFKTKKKTHKENQQHSYIHLLSTQAHPTLIHTQTGVGLWKGHGVFIYSAQKRLLDIIQNRRLSPPIKRGFMGAWAKWCIGRAGRGVKLWRGRATLGFDIQVNADGTAANRDI